VAKKIALLVSILFHPLLIPTLIFVFLLFGVPDVSASHYLNRWIILSLVFLTTFFIPMLSIWTMKLTGNITSLQLMDKEERVFPFSMVSLFFVISTYLFHIKFDLEPVFILAMTSITICIILLASITFFWKISAHMTGISGFLAIIIVLAFKNPSINLVNFLLFATVSSGLIGSARLYLNAHTPLEVLGGFILGFSVCFWGFYLYM
jgi:membrane-associated phospholipid phosphatase